MASLLQHIKAYWGRAPWLVDQLDVLDYTFLTTIQINAMRAVQKRLNTSQDEHSNVHIQNNKHDIGGTVISGTTGSGKT